MQQRPVDGGFLISQGWLREEGSRANPISLKIPCNSLFGFQAGIFETLYFISAYGGYCRCDRSYSVAPINGPAPAQAAAETGAQPERRIPIQAQVLGKSAEHRLGAGILLPVQIVHQLSSFQCSGPPTGDFARAPASRAAIDAIVTLRYVAFATD